MNENNDSQVLPDPDEWDEVATHTGVRPLPKPVDTAASGSFAEEQSERFAIIRPRKHPQMTVPFHRTLRFGRSPDNTVHFNEDPRISRHHCEIIRTDEGFFLEDLGSKNGTYIDGVSWEKRRLLGGETIRIGDSEFQISFYP
jgi:pSer/pThr/pTyr-binding forkhead associated (FHA) protein